MTTIGYWDVRGLGQPIRYLLAYLNVEFTNKVYTGEAEDWFNKDKQELGIPLPNLPYYIDSEVKLTESSVIPVYIIKKYKRLDLLGINPDESNSDKETRVSQLISIISDLRSNIFYDYYNPYTTFDEIKDKLYQDKYSKYHKKLLDYLGEKQFLEGDLTYADFLYYEALQYLKHYFPQTVLPVEYIQRFENIPRIKEYLASPACIKEF